jgi:hypothetical protein
MAPEGTSSMPMLSSFFCPPPDSSTILTADEPISMAMRGRLNIEPAKWVVNDLEIQNASGNRNRPVTGAATFIYDMIFSFQTGGVNFMNICQNSVASAFG